jgi:hypothetical protein
MTIVTTDATTGVILARAKTRTAVMATAMGTATVEA